QTEQEDGCAGHALSEFQQGGADTLCNELGWPSMPEIIRPNQQHDSLWRRAVQMAVLQPPPQMIGAVATDAGVQHPAGRHVLIPDSAIEIFSEGIAKKQRSMRLRL